MREPRSPNRGSLSKEEKRNHLTASTLAQRAQPCLTGNVRLPYYCSTNWRPGGVSSVKGYGSGPHTLLCEVRAAEPNQTKTEKENPDSFPSIHGSMPKRLCSFFAFPPGLRASDGDIISSNQKEAT